MLELKSLKLKNIGKIRSKEIEFKKGTNLIDAPNGSGKTTILNIISLLLLNRYEGNLESTLNNSSTEGFAELEFSYDENNYISSIEIIKEKKTVKSAKTLTKNGNVIAKGEDVEKELNKILAPVLTEYSLFCKQKGTKITTVSDSERRDILTQLCELDYTKKIKEIIELEIDNLKNIINSKEKEEYALENKTYNYGTERGLSYLWTEADEKKLAKLEELQKDYESNLENETKLTKLLEKIKSAKNSLAQKKVEYSLDTLDTELQELLESIKNKHKSILDNLKTKFESDKASLTEEIADLEKTISSNEEELSKIKLTKVIKFDETPLIEARQNYANLVANSKLAFSNAEKLKNGICPTCGGNCNGKHDEIYNEACSLEKQSIECKGVISDLESKKEEYEQRIETNNKNKSLKESLNFKIESLKSSLSNKRDNLDKLSNSYSSSVETENKSWEEKISSTNTLYMEKKANAENVIKSAEEVLKNLEEEERNSTPINPDLKDNSAEIRELKNSKQVYLDCISYNKAIEENNNKLKTEEAEDKKTLKLIKDELNNLKQSLADYTISKEVMLKTFPTWSLEKISDSIVTEINDMIETIYDKSLNIKFDANKNSLKMTFTCDGERDLPILKLSGAEDNIVNLAVQSTFNKKQGLNCIILDEADNFCSDKTAESFYDCMLELSNIYNQMLVITHKKEMKTRFIQNGCNIIKL